MRILVFNNGEEDPIVGDGSLLAPPMPPSASFLHRRALEQPISQLGRGAEVQEGADRFDNATNSLGYTYSV